MASGKTFRLGKTLVNLSGKGVATKNTDTGEVRRFPFPWTQLKGARQEEAYQEDSYNDARSDQDDRAAYYGDQGYGSQDYDGQDYGEVYDDGYEEGGYEDDADYYAPDDDYGAQPAGNVLDSPWFMWAALILLPPLGIWLLWRNNRFELTTRSAISAAALIWFIIMLIWLFSGINRGRDNQITPPITTPSPSPTLSFNSATSTPVPQDTPIPQQPSAAPAAPTTAPTDDPSTGGTTTEATAEPSAAPDFVWSTQGGKNYHINPTCQGMTNAQRITLAAAINRSQTACPVCMPGATATVAPSATPLPDDMYYSRPDGTWYHSQPNCQGMTSAQAVTLATALSRNQTPCPVCIGTVYVTDKGSWYHSDSSCQGMKNAYLTTVDDAVEKGKTICPVCGGNISATPTTTTGNNNTTGATTTTSTSFWATETGKYYHSDATCSGMKNATRVSAAAAENNGKTPCPKCLGGNSANATFWMTQKGTWYHSLATCQGMKNATRTTEANAIAAGKTPCPECVGKSSVGSTVNVNVGDTANTGNTTVTSGVTTYYSTPDGTYFHSNATCSGMKNAQAVSSQEIADRGQLPCPTCIGTSGTYYATLTGSYYHSKPNCTGMKNASIVTLAMINARGQTACPVCIGASNESGSGGTTYYWATLKGKYYHNKSSCGGMKGAAKITASDAEARGQEPCPTCVGSVYGTSDGTYYHKNRTCGGMKDAQPMTILAAEQSGKTPCPVCVLSEEPTPAPGEDDNDGSLYYYSTYGGVYYHREPNCSGMKSAEKVTEGIALARNQTPCPVCIGSVYATELGDYYHSDPTCQGMKGATLVSIDTAELRGQAPCPVCLAGPTQAPLVIDEPDEGGQPEEGGSSSPITVDLDATHVYCTLTGRYYHSRKNCSGMKNAADVTLRWALEHNFTKCPDCDAPEAPVMS